MFTLVTGLDFPAGGIWRVYRGRADRENQIKELKFDFVADSFNTQDFWATDAALNTAMLAYNQMSLMRQSGSAQNESGETGCDVGAAHTENVALQTVRQDHLHHHR